MSYVKHVQLKLRIDMKILMLGDIVGKSGRTAVQSFLKDREYDIVIANGENAAGGFGLTTRTARELFDAGVSVITSGNHIWHQKEIFDNLDRMDYPVLRPANVPPGNPGKDFFRFNLGGNSVMVVNLQGRLFMPMSLDCPYRKVDRILSGNSADIIIVDMHAEATSEKEIMGRHLDGRVTVVAGTHTHVLTADARLLPRGTAYITDLGMCGSGAGIIGIETKGARHRMLTGRPTSLKIASGNPVVNGLEITLSSSLEVSGLRIVNERE